MSQAFLITVRSLTGTFHGIGDRGRAEWPPSPFRLFQALIAGAHGGRWVAEDPDRDAAFSWLEAQDPPVIFAPRAEARAAMTLFVPNNDLDAKGGDPQRVGEIRSSKTIQPQIFDAELPIHYLWTDVTDDAPSALSAYVKRLHTLGLGLDAAFAEARFLADAALAAFTPDPRLIRHQPGGVGKVPVPAAGSYASLLTRHEAFRERLRVEGKGSKAKTAFRQPPKARHGSVGYDTPPHRLFFVLRRGDAREKPQPVPAVRTVRLVETIRDRIAAAFEGNPLIDRLVTGRSAGPKDIADRLRIIPLPSTGHEHSDLLIRRVLIEIPQTSPLSPQAIAWALDGHEVALSSDGPALIIAASSADSVTRRYVEQASRSWRSVTPVALTRRDEAMVCKALRQAGIDATLRDAALRLEPFTKKGRLAADYVAGTRFSPAKTLHATLHFAQPVKGPVVIGDGRFLGLGLCEPFDAKVPDSWAFLFGEPIPLSAHIEVARQFRRNLMARVQAVIGKKELPSVITGHEPDGRPLRGGNHEHVFYRAVTRAGRLAGLEVLAPHLVAGGKAASGWVEARRILDEALSDFSSLHYRGYVGLVRIASAYPAPSRCFASVTPYVTTRRPRPSDDRPEFLKSDVTRELQRCGLTPDAYPKISALKLESSGRLSAHLQIVLRSACTKHLLLGATSHFGGGTFDKSGDD